MAPKGIQTALVFNGLLSRLRPRVLVVFLLRGFGGPGGVRESTADSIVGSIWLHPLPGQGLGLGFSLSGPLWGFGGPGVVRESTADLIVESIWPHPRF